MSLQAYKPTSLQLDFIDGMRALAALYIVFHHLFQTVDYLPLPLIWLRYGFEVVGIFITISGFCLALPLAKGQRWKINALPFYKRRARRILPPYYAALAIGLTLVVAYAIRSYPQDYIGTRFSWAMVWSHLFLIQNWMPTQLTTVDGPLWSVAVECQIYLFFPLLVFLRSKVGRWYLLAVCYVVVEAIGVITHHGGYCGLLFLFGIGMLGADLAFTSSSRKWLLPAASVSGVLLFLTYNWHRNISECMLGFTVASLMAYFAQVRGSIGCRLLSWKPMAWIGTFSYSIYLVHSFFEVGTCRWLAHHSSAWRAASHPLHAAFLLLTIPPALLFSYGFHLLFEKPFMSATRKHAEDRYSSQDIASVPPAIEHQHLQSGF